MHSRIVTTAALSLLMLSAHPSRAEDDKPATSLRLVKEFELPGHPARMHVDGANVFVESGSSLTAIDTKRTRKLWESRDVAQASYAPYEGNHFDAGRVRGVLLPKGDAIVLPGKDLGTLVALSRKSGKVLWRHVPPEAKYEDLRMRIAMRGTGAFACFRNRVVRLRLKDGEVVWSRPFKTQQPYQMPVFVDGLLSLGTLAFDAKTGAEVWQLDAPLSGLVGEPITAVGTVFFTTNHGSNVLYAVEGKTGKLLSAVHPSKDEAPMGILPPPVANEHHLLVSVFDQEDGGKSTLLGLDPRTRKERWRLKLPAIVSRQGALDGHTAYFYTWDKEILRVDCRKGRIDLVFKPPLETGETYEENNFGRVRGGQDVAAMAVVDGALVVLISAEYPHATHNQMHSGAGGSAGNRTRLRIYR